MCLAIIGSGLADHDKITPGGDTALHMAVAVCSTPVVQALVSGQAKLNIKDKGGCTALIRSIMAACSGRDKDHETRSLIIIRGQ